MEVKKKTKSSNNMCLCMCVKCKRHVMKDRLVFVKSISPPTCDKCGGLLSNVENVPLPSKKKKKRPYRHKKISKGKYLKRGYSAMWTPLFRKCVRELDNNKCCLCQRTAQYERQHYKLSTLSIHHIDKNKLNCELDNLITLCSTCHGKIHSKKGLPKETIIAARESQRSKHKNIQEAFEKLKEKYKDTYKQ